MKMTALLVGCALLFGGCMPSSATGINPEDIDFVQLKPLQSGQETAVITTSLGTITMVLFPNEAPKTVAHFKQLVEEGFYNDQPILIHDGLKSFIAGATDPDGMAGKLVTEDSKPIECEITPNLWHFSGAVSVVGYEENKLTRQMYSDSRFFVMGDVEATSEMAAQMEEYEYPEKVINAYKEYGGQPQYTGSYTIFGQVIDGMEVVKKISELPRENEESNYPADGTKILKVELSTYQEGDPASDALCEKDLSAQQEAWDAASSAVESTQDASSAAA